MIDYDRYFPFTPQKIPDKVVQTRSPDGQLCLLFHSRLLRDGYFNIPDNRILLSIECAFDMPGPCLIYTSSMFYLRFIYA